MRGLRRTHVVLAWALAAVLPSVANAQAPAGNTPQARPNPPRPQNGVRRRAYPLYYSDDSRPGYRNPGGVGRYAEYYPAGNQFQTGAPREPSRAPTFNAGLGLPTVQDQIAAQRLGVMKYNSIQQSINSYARPYYPYGFGFGFGGGFYGGYN